MDEPTVVPRAEWLAARKELLVTEKELTRARNALSAERRALPAVRIGRPYAFERPDGTSTLLDLFDGKRQLIVYHLMFEPRLGRGLRELPVLRRHLYRRRRPPPGARHRLRRHLARPDRQDPRLQAAHGVAVPVALLI